MAQPVDTSNKSRWFNRLTWVSAVLFAIFWSVDAFFFWLFLGLLISFGTYALFYSGIKFTFLGQPKTRARYQQYDSQTEGTIPSDQLRVRKNLRIFFIIGGSIFVFLFIVGSLADSEDQSTAVPVEQEISVPAENSEASGYLSKGIDLYDNGQYDSALFYYDKALVLNPDEPEIHYSKALVYFMKQDYRRSIQLARNSLQVDPDYDEAWWLVGHDYYSLSQYDSAIESLERAYANDFREPSFLQLMGESYQKKGNDSKAKSLYLEVIERDTTNVDVYNELAKLDPENAGMYRSRASAVKKVAQ